MKNTVFILLLAIVAAVCGCSNQPDPAIEVSRDATLMRDQFATTRISVSAPRGHRIRVMHEGRRTEEIELNSPSSEGGRVEAELFFVATLVPLPDGKEAWLHWTAHLRSGGSNLGGPTEAPRLVAASRLDDVFEISVREGTRARGDAIASVKVGEGRYDFIIE